MTEMVITGYTRNCRKCGPNRGWASQPQAGTCTYEPAGAPCGEPYTADDWTATYGAPEPEPKPKRPSTSYTIADDHVTLDMPGKFDDFFSGSDVAQGHISMEQSGYPGAPGLYKAYQESLKIVRGKGYSLRLTIPRDEHLDAVLDCLWQYADTCVSCNEDNAAEGDNQARSEMRAGATLRDRITGLEDALDRA